MASPQPSPSCNEQIPTQDDLDMKPWKYYGYKAFSEWGGSDDDFFVLRRFKSLNTRVILYMQDGITQVEAQLRELDREHSRVGAEDIHNGSFRCDVAGLPQRKIIIDQALQKLKEYNDYVASYAAICGRPRAPQHAIQNVKTWLKDFGGIYEPESQYIHSTEDLVSICHRVKTPLRRFFERIEIFRYSRIFREEREKTPTSPEYDPETTLYQSDARVERACTVIITAVGLFMLITPLWWLMFVESKLKQLGIITGFIVLFLIMISSVTIAKPFESLAGTAGYSAVLLVFMQIGGSK